MRKIKAPIENLERLQRQKASAINPPRPTNEPVIHRDEDTLNPLEERVKEIFNIIDSHKRPAGNMLFFVMYDIESNKVRYNIAKYLERKGCTRIQKSIFLADLDNATYSKIRNDLAKVQSLYENNDSIIICPISTDLINNMKIIGKSIDVEVIMKTRNTLFF